MARLAKVFPVVLVLVLGCQNKFSSEHKFSMQLGEVQDIVVDAPTSEQKVLVTLASDQPVDVVVRLKKVFDANKTQPQLGSLKQSSKGTLDVKIPANEAFVVTVMEVTKPTQCTLKIAGQ